MVSAGHVGGNICVPHYVMLIQLRDTLPTLPPPLCNLFVLISLLTMGEGEPGFPFLVSREQQTLLPSGACHNV